MTPQFAECFENGETHAVGEQGCIQSAVKPPFCKSLFVAAKNVFKSFPVAWYEEVIGETR